MIVSTSSNMQFDNDIVTYRKGKRKTREIECSTKEFIGEGISGKVYKSAINSNHVVKKSCYSLKREFAIGRAFDHGNLVKHHKLFIKEYSDEKVKSKLLMNYAPGSTLGSCDAKFNKEQSKKFIEQTKNCCLYLYDKNIVWRDLHSGNIIIGKNDQVTFIDYESWIEKKDSDKTISLLEGSIDIVKLIIKNTMVENFVKQKIAFPDSFFDNKSINAEISNPFAFELDGKTKARIQKNQETQNINELEFYFDAVLEKLEAL